MNTTPLADQLHHGAAVGLAVFAAAEEAVAVAVVGVAAVATAAAAAWLTSVKPGHGKPIQPLEETGFGY